MLLPATFLWMPLGGPGNRDLEIGLWVTGTRRKSGGLNSQGCPQPDSKTRGSQSGNSGLPFRVHELLSLNIKTRMFISYRKDPQLSEIINGYSPQMLRTALTEGCSASKKQQRGARDFLLDTPSVLGVSFLISTSVPVFSEWS